MKQIAAAKFKAQCLALLDRGGPDGIIITKHGKAIAKLVPIESGCEGLISRFEVTNAQYAEFLNEKAASDPFGLYTPNMSVGYGGIARSGTSGSYSYSVTSGRGDKPVTYISFYDALRFTNWLRNGQGSGDTETVCAAPTATPNTANCAPAVQNLTDIGSYPNSASPYGTFDQGGNVWEWNEQIVNDVSRGNRGGSWGGTAAGGLVATFRNVGGPAFQTSGYGFRVPEPESSLLPAVIALAGLAARQERRKRNI